MSEAWIDIAKKYVIMAKLAVEDKNFGGAGRHEERLETFNKLVRAAKQEENQWALADLLNHLHEQSLDILGYTWESPELFGEAFNGEKCSWYLTTKKIGHHIREYASKWMEKEHAEARKTYTITANKQRITIASTFLKNSYSINMRLGDVIRGQFNELPSWIHNEYSYAEEARKAFFNKLNPETIIGTNQEDWSLNGLQNYAKALQRYVAIKEIHHYGRKAEQEHGGSYDQRKEYTLSEHLIKTLQQTNQLEVPEKTIIKLNFTQFLK